VVKIGEGWVEQKLLSLKAGLPNESNILQDSHNNALVISQTSILADKYV
jgi:hypothetical protein